MLPASDLQLPGYAFSSLYDEVSSTMDVARERVSDVCEGEGDTCAGLVVARSQTAGRGRQGRSWVSQEGAFMGTFLFATSLPVAHLSGYSLAVGVGVAHALREFGAAVALKWPNDIVVNKAQAIQKVGGVLIEVQELSGKRVLLVGLGLNLSCAPADVAHSTALAALVATDRVPSFVGVTHSLARHLLDVHREFSKGAGFGAFQSRWDALSCYESGQTQLSIEVTPHSTVSGTYAGIHASGALVIFVAGEERLIHSGHVVASS